VTKERPGSPRARLFVALDFPSAGIAAWRDEIFGGRRDVRLLAPETLHVTLVFLGYLPEKAIPRVEACLATAAGSPAPVLTPLAVKPLPPRRPRLFALDLADDAGRAVALQAGLSDALEAERLYTPEKRAFWPHLTLARVKRGETAAPVPASAPPPPPEPLEARELVLYQSHLSPRGARYEALARVELA